MVEKKEQMIQNNQLNYEFFSQATIEKVLGIFKTSNKGVSDERVEELREEYGENVISHGKKTPLIVEILKAYFTPFTIVLIVLAVISFITDYVIVPVAERDLTGVLIITAMVALSGTMT